MPKNRIRRALECDIHAADEASLEWRAKKLG